MNYGYFRYKIESSGFYEQTKSNIGDLAYIVKKEFYNEFVVILDDINIFTPSRIEIFCDIVGMYLDISEEKEVGGWKEPEEYRIEGHLFFIQFNIRDIKSIEIKDKVSHMERLRYLREQEIRMFDR